jgi:hypothetical protein
VVTDTSPDYGPNNDEIPVNDTRTRESNRLGKIVSTQSLPQIDSSLFAKRGNHFAGVCIECIQIVHHPGKDTAVLSVTPEGQSARWLTAVDTGIELPPQLTGRGVQRDDFLRGGICEESAPDDDRIRFQTALFGGIKRPGLFKPVYVRSVDLRKLRVVIALNLSAIHGPVCTVR